MLLHTSILNTIHSHPMSRGDLPAKQPRKYDLTLYVLQKMPSAFSGSKPFGLLHHQKNENLTGGENCLFHHTKCMSMSIEQASHHLHPLMRSLFGAAVQLVALLHRKDKDPSRGGEGAVEADVLQGRSSCQAQCSQSLNGAGCCC